MTTANRERIRRKYGMRLPLPEQTMQLYTLERILADMEWKAAYLAQALAAENAPSSTNGNATCADWILEGVVKALQIVRNIKTEQIQ